MNGLKSGSDCRGNIEDCGKKYMVLMIGVKPISSSLEPKRSIQLSYTSKVREKIIKLAVSSGLEPQPN